MKKKVTVFGSAQPKPGEDSYQQAYQLGRLLAGAGYDVITGGYQGTMEAVSKGAADVGAHVIGVTCEEIEKWRDTGVNQWVDEEWVLYSIQDRMINLMDHCDAAIALPGGVGTLAEITLLWNRMVIQAISPYPFVLIGSGWKKTFNTLFEGQNHNIANADRKLLTFAGDIEESVEILQKLLA